MFRTSILRQQRSLAQNLAQATKAQSTAFSSQIPTPFRTLPATYKTTARRWQSTEAAKAEEQTPPATEEAKAEDPIKKELEAKSKEVVDLKDKYLRSVADFRNLQEQTRRQMDDARKFAIQRFASDLLDSIDNLDRAMGAVPAASLAPVTDATPSTDTPNHAQDLQNLHSGLKMTDDILMNVLKKHGLERFDPIEREGKKFDPNTDEATFFMKQEGKEDGEVFFTQSKGFRLNGRVIRAAKVGVVKNS